MTQPFRLDRFVSAQEPFMSAVMTELRAGAKRSHWMWFVFPQLAGLGRSPTARFYALASLAEAQAYLAHPVLGARLRDCAAMVLTVAGRTAHDIFGSPDDLKLQSCMTLFARAAPGPSSFHDVLDRYFGGREDPATLSLLTVR